MSWTKKRKVIHTYTCWQRQQQQQQPSNENWPHVCIVNCDDADTQHSIAWHLEIFSKKKKLIKTACVRVRVPPVYGANTRTTTHNCQFLILFCFRLKEKEWKKERKRENISINDEPPSESMQLCNYSRIQFKRTNFIVFTCISSKPSAKWMIFHFFFVFLLFISRNKNEHFHSARPNEFRNSIWTLMQT